MPYSNPNRVGLRTNEEAWDLALDNKNLMFKVLNAYVSKHSLPYYKGEALRTELESFAWEGFFDACKSWDETKGFQLSTYAYPSITNALNTRMKVLERMGSSMQGHYTKGEKGERPRLSSLEGIDKVYASKVGAIDAVDSIADLKPNPMQEPEPSMEDVIVNSIYQEELMHKIRAIVKGMSEPHATVFTLAFLTEPTHDRSRYSVSVTTGWTTREIAEKHRQSTSWVKSILDEAIEYIRLHLEQEGETND